MDTCSKPTHTESRSRSPTSTRDALLDLLEQRKMGARAEERGKLRLAAQWGVVNPATADTGTATWAGASLLGGDLDAGRVPRRGRHPRGLRVRSRAASPPRRVSRP